MLSLFSFSPEFFFGCVYLSPRQSIITIYIPQTDPGCSPVWRPRCYRWGARLCEHNKLPHILSATINYTPLCSAIERRTSRQKKRCWSYWTAIPFARLNSPPGALIRRPENFIDYVDTHFPSTSSQPCLFIELFAFHFGPGVRCLVSLSAVRHELFPRLIYISPSKCNAPAHWKYRQFYFC